MIEIDRDDIRRGRQCERITPDPCAEVNNHMSSKPVRLVFRDQLRGRLFHALGVNPHERPSLELQRGLLPGLRQSHGRRDGLRRGMLPQPGELGRAHRARQADLLQQAAAGFG